MNFPYKIAVVGKGGVGKTAITVLIAKILQDYNYKLLLIDADPTHPHLSKMVDLIPSNSLEKIRTNIIEKTLKKEKSIKEIAKEVDYQVYNAIIESKNFSLLSIGQPEDPGCFCPSNTILKRVIKSISQDYEIILIDCEAGLEQINRKVIENIDLLLIVTDISIRSVETADSIRKSAQKFTNYEKIAIIINKVEGDITRIISKLNELNLPILGQIPRDLNLIELDLEGIPIINIDTNSPSYKSLRKIMLRILEID